MLKSDRIFWDNKKARLIKIKRAEYSKAVYLVTHSTWRQPQIQTP